MLMIRLQRVGRKNDPSFRVVLTDKRNSTKSGKFLDILGSYNARRGKAELDKERLKHWVANGAQLTATVHNLFVNHKLLNDSKLTFGNKPKKATEPEVALKEVATPSAETPAADAVAS